MSTCTIFEYLPKLCTWEYILSIYLNYIHGNIYLSIYLNYIMYMGILECLPAQYLSIYLNNIHGNLFIYLVSIKYIHGIIYIYILVYLPELYTRTWENMYLSIFQNYIHGIIYIYLSIYLNYIHRYILAYLPELYT